MTEREKIEGKIGENTENLRFLAGKIGTMCHTPKYDPSYSVVKLDGWTKDYEKLQAKDIELHVQLDQLIHSPEYQKAMNDAVAKLAVRRDALLKELKTVKDRVTHLRYSAPGAIVEGRDPLKLSEELADLERQELSLAQALQWTQAGIQKVTG